MTIESHHQMNKYFPVLLLLLSSCIGMSQIMDIEISDESGQNEWIDHLNEVNDFAFEWVTNN